MKKILIGILCLIIVVALALIPFLGKKNDDLKKVRVAEVTHSIFYSPLYVADALGYFEDEGIDVEIILTSGADKVTTAVLSGDVEVGFCGSEATIYVYNNGEKDYLVNFSGLTKKDGSFLVSRVKEDNFTVKNLVGKHVIAGRKAGMPAMTLEYAINQNGVSTDEMNFDTSIDFASTTGAFIGGTGDYVALFEPSALKLEKENYGYVVASVGELGGVVPYTAFNAKKSYIEENEDIIKGFTKAIQKGIDYVHNHTNEEIASEIASYFPDTTYSDLAKVVQRYMDIDAWFTNTKIEEENFNHVMDIMENAGELSKKAPHDKLVINVK